MATETSNATKKLLYVPILKSKQGEFKAMRELSTNVINSIIPLIEIVDGGNLKKKSLQEFFQKKYNELINAWPLETRIFIDTSDLEQEPGYAKSCISFFRILNEANIFAIPVVNAKSKLEHVSCLKEQVNSIGNVLIRVDADTALNIDYGEIIQPILTELEINVKNTYLMIDFADVPADQQRIYSSTIEQIINNFHNIERFKEFVLAMTSFPRDLSSIKPDTIGAICRWEWVIYKSLFGKQLDRYPVFSDYGISASEMVDFDPTKMTVSASVRYTSEDDWMIFKGRSVKHGFDQFYRLSKLIIDSKYYSGELFSAGDKAIADKAIRRGTPGSLSIWRFIGANHHISFVVNQIAKLNAS